jgi:hypothetical protein
MIQRFLFNRIDTEPAASAVRGEHQSVAYTLTDKAKSALPLVQFAKTRAEPALDAPVGQHHPPVRRMIRLTQLCDH